MPAAGRRDAAWAQQAGDPRQVRDAHSRNTKHAASSRREDAPLAALLPIATGHEFPDPRPGAGACGRAGSPWKGRGRQLPRPCKEPPSSPARARHRGVAQPRPRTILLHKLLQFIVFLRRPLAHSAAWLCARHRVSALGPSWGPLSSLVARRAPCRAAHVQAGQSFTPPEDPRRRKELRERVTRSHRL